MPRLADVRDAVADDRQVPQTQEVHLQQTDGLTTVIHPVMIAPSCGRFHSGMASMRGSELMMTAHAWTPALQNQTLQPRAVS